MNASADEIRRLRQARPRSWFLRASGLGLLALGICSWLATDLGVREMFSARRWTNLCAFLEELKPFPLQERPFDGGVLSQWTWDLMRDRGLEATATTLAISIAAIFLAGCAGAVLAFLGAGTLMTESAYLPPHHRISAPVRWLWRSLRSLPRVFMVFVRAIPEYIWAFLLLAVFGPISWPLVLALAVHNSGILGRLGAEVVENTESSSLSALRALGAGRRQIITTAIFPMGFSRFFLFLLYRWETCVREATVLGMLGISSLGFWIQDSRARQHYDEMFFLILLGAALVLLGDLASAYTREWLRREH